MSKKKFGIFSVFTDFSYSVCTDFWESHLGTLLLLTKHARRGRMMNVRKRERSPDFSRPHLGPVPRPQISRKSGTPDKRFNYFDLSHCRRLCNPFPLFTWLRPLLDGRGYTRSSFRVFAGLFSAHTSKPIIMVGRVISSFFFRNIVAGVGLRGTCIIVWGNKRLWRQK